MKIEYSNNQVIHMRIPGDWKTVCGKKIPVPGELDETDFIPRTSTETVEVSLGPDLSGVTCPECIDVIQTRKLRQQARQSQGRTF
jgi:hypothetical protein